MENEQNDDKSIQNMINQAKTMKDNAPIMKLNEKEIYLLGNSHKVLFYKKNKTKITFRLNKHQEYFITGQIIKILQDKDNFYDFLIVVLLENEEKAMYSSWEIDFETLTPLKYNPIRYFIREIISESIKNKVFERDNYECRLNLNGCTKKAEEVDHIIPISKGGLSIIDNLQSSCSNCNRKKSNNLIF